MFSSVYKTTLKNLFRSLIFWLAAAFVIGVTVYNFAKGHFGQYSHTLNEMIPDTDPRFVLSMNQYRNLIGNVCISDVMYYAMPIFTVISTVLVLNRDYGDQFFEIEKASGVKAITYTGGRLAALVTVNFALAAITCFLGTHMYLFFRATQQVLPKNHPPYILCYAGNQSLRNHSKNKYYKCNHRFPLGLIGKLGYSSSRQTYYCPTSPAR